MKSVTTTCGYCGCGCGIQYFVDDNNCIVSVAPVEEHPVSKGKLCVKGWEGHSFIRHKDRLTSPLLRNSLGTFDSISWSEAYSLIAERFSAIKKKYGGKSIATFSSARCTNEENYLLAKVTRTVFGSPNIDHCARL